MSKAAELAKWGEVSTNGQVSGRRNIVINGAMKVAQRATSSAGLGASDGYFTVDRFKMITGGSAGRFTQSQVAVSDLSGFTKALKLECTTADTSVAASEYLLLEQSFEGQDVQQLKKGTSEAEKVTISFYVKGNANATYVLELYDGDNSRNFSQSFNVTTSWNRIILTYSGDTTGAFDNDNAQSLRLFFWLHSGSDYSSGTLSTTWHTTSANRAVGISSFFDSTDRTFFITGLQMEVGSVATPFEHKSYGEELALCQRYYWNLVNGTDNEIGIGAYQTSSELNNIIQFPVLMRTGPTLDIVTGTNYYKINRSGASDGFNSFTIARATTRNALIYNGSEISGTAGQAGETQSGNASSFLSFTAEL